MFDVPMQDEWLTQIGTVSAAVIFACRRKFHRMMVIQDLVEHWKINDDDSHRARN